MNMMQLMVEGLQKIDERREKMAAIYTLCHSYLEQVVNVAPEVNGEAVEYLMDDYPMADDEASFITIRAQPVSPDEEKSIITIGIHANGEANVSGIGLDVHSTPAVFDFDDYSVSEAFAKIVTSIENLDGNYFGPHLRHAQNVIKQDMGVALANGPQLSL